MTELQKLTMLRGRQERRLKDLVQIYGKLDPEHPLQAYSIQRIKYLEERIEEEKKKRA